MIIRSMPPTNTTAITADRIKAKATGTASSSRPNSATTSTPRKVMTRVARPSSFFLFFLPFDRIDDRRLLAEARERELQRDQRGPDGQRQIGVEHRDLERRRILTGVEEREAHAGPGEHAGRRENREIAKP